MEILSKCGESGRNLHCCLFVSRHISPVLLTESFMGCCYCFLQLFNTGYILSVFTSGFSLDSRLELSWEWQKNESRRFSRHESLLFTCLYSFRFFYACLIKADLVLNYMFWFIFCCCFLLKIMTWRFSTMCNESDLKHLCVV